MATLVVELDDSSVLRLRALAIHPVIRADHVTLHHGVLERDFSTSWVPGAQPVGARVEVRAIGMCRDSELQALVVEMAGSTLRPADGGTLHITISRTMNAQSAMSNALITRVAAEPCDIVVSGVIAWRRKG